jgi:hypothetical protein
MNNKKYDTCLFIDTKGQLFRLKCPFLVKLNTDITDSHTFKVSKIIFANHNQVLFEMDGKELHNQCFTPIRRHQL